MIKKVCTFLFASFVILNNVNFVSCASRILDYSQYTSNINSRNEKRTILSEEFRPLTVSCQAPASIIYCSLQHPDGRIIAPDSKNETYAFDTQNLNIGICSLTLKMGNQTDSGDWTCYMGAKSVGLEMTEVVSVRVVGAIAAVEREIYANQGDNVTIHCVTAGGYEELNYCRFITPNGTGFGIDDSITEEKAIGGEFFFPSISQTYLGDCSVTVKTLASWHYGEWRCMGMLRTADIEHMDTIVIKPISDANIFSMASVTGIVVGVGVLVIIVTVIMWKRGAFPRMRLLGRTDTTRQMEEPVQARFSGDSGESVVRLNVGQTPADVLPPQRYGGTISSTQT